MKAFLSLLAILWNFAFKWVYLSFSTLLFASSLFTVICKVSSDSHFSLLHFFLLQTTSSNNTRENSTRGRHQMVNTKIRLIMFLAAKDGEAIYSQQKQYTVVDVTGRSKVCCCKERYCIGTWNVRPMDQGKLEVVKLEMARVNINILGIRELKWTGMGEFNSDDRYIYYCGQ